MKALPQQYSSLYRSNSRNIDSVPASVLFMMVGILILFFPHHGNAFQRGCEAIIFAEIVSGEYASNGKRFVGAADGVVQYEERLVEVDGRGNCAGKHQANSVCRPKARDAAWKCGAAMYYSRDNRQIIHEKCGPSSNAVVREWAPYLQFSGKGDDAPLEVWNDIDSLIQYQTCCTRGFAAIKTAYLRIGFQCNSSRDVLGFTSAEARRGDRAQAACWKNEVLEPSYRVDCTAVRASGLCGDLSQPKPPRTTEKPPSPRTGELERDTRPKATTSSTTSTSSASQDQIAEALEKKKNQSVGGAARTNPGGGATELASNLTIRALLTKGAREQIISNPMFLDDFLIYGEGLGRNQGMRLVDFEMVVSRGVYYVGLWERGSGASVFKKSLPVADFNQLHKDMQGQGMVLKDYELVQKRGQVEVVSLWVAGNARQIFSYAMSEANFKKRTNTLKQRNMFPVDIEVHQQDGKLRYAALWQKAGGGGQVDEGVRDAQFMPAVTMKNFRTIRDDLSQRGKRVVDMEMIELNGEMHVTALWVDGKGKSGITKPRRFAEFMRFIEGKPKQFVEDLEMYKGKK